MVSKWSSIAMSACLGCGRIGFDGVPSAIDAPTAVVADIEMESAVVTSPFAVVMDDSASNGRYVFDGNGPGLSGAGSAVVGFTLETAGTYYLWARGLALDMTTDSFFVSIDGDSNLDLFASDCLIGPDWQWSALRPPYFCANPMAPPPLGLVLAAGPHDLRFSSREGQSSIDRLRITDDPAFIPTD